MQGAYELLTHLSGGSQVPLTFGHVTKGKFGPLLQQSLSADAWSSLTARGQRLLCLRPSLFAAEPLGSERAKPRRVLTPGRAGHADGRGDVDDVHRGGERKGAGGTHGTPRDPSTSSRAQRSRVGQGLSEREFKDVLVSWIVGAAGAAEQPAVLSTVFRAAVSSNPPPLARAFVAAVR